MSGSHTGIDGYRFDRRFLWIEVGDEVPTDRTLDLQHLPAQRRNNSTFFGGP